MRAYPSHYFENGAYPSHYFKKGAYLSHFGRGLFEEEGGLMRGIISKMGLIWVISRLIPTTYNAAILRLQVHLPDQRALSSGLLTTYVRLLNPLLPVAMRI